MQPIIVPGQVYLNQTLNEYAIIANANQGEIKYRGPGFSGVLDVEVFLDKFGPVDPNDLDSGERKTLEGLLPAGAILKTGWVHVGGFDDEDE